MSLHFSGSPWFLLLALPGAYLLWRQYRGAAGGRRLALPGLQAAALLVLIASLTAPELVRRDAKFHNPAVLILRDRSGSFAGGGYLGLGAAYAGAEEILKREYRGRRFDVAVADFHERAWPVSGFSATVSRGVPDASAAIPRAAGGATPDEGGEFPLTSFAALADFLDSAGPANLQGVFLFSDGRANLDSGLASRDFRVPVFPLVLPVDSVSEVQPARVSFSPAAEPGRPGELRVEWTPVGPLRGAPSFRLLSEGRTALSAELPAGEGDGPRRAQLPWQPASPAGVQGWRAVIQGAGMGGNFNAYNDTLSVAAGHGEEGRIFMGKPARSLDEKGMADLLRAGGARVEWTGAGELSARAPTGKDQVWVEAGALTEGGAWLAALRGSPAKVVAYARPGSLPAAMAGLGLRGLDFSLEADVRPARAAGDVFPDGVVELKSMASGGLAAPASQPPWREAAALVEAGRRGLLMGWFPLGAGREGFFFCLPPLWPLLFDPQSDFATRENLAGYFRAVSRLAERDEAGVRASLPGRVLAGVPFDLEFAVPLPADAAAPAGDAASQSPSPAAPEGNLRVSVRGPAGSAEEWPLRGPGPGLFRLEGRVLGRGTHTLELRRGGETLWRDSVAVAPRASLELARIGFDRAALRDLASRSGGWLLTPADAKDPAKVTLQLPDLPGAQVREERTRSTRLYNTRLGFLLIAALLSASWLLRKRWDFD